jgi:hypothetical protein
MIGRSRHLPATAGLLALMLTAGPAVGQETWSLRADGSVGAFGGPLEFGSISAVAVGPRGVYVGDDMNGRIVILNRNLTHVRSVGRKGSGPAEFRSIAGLTVRGDTIYVFDPALLRMTAITDAGRSVWTQTNIPHMADEGAPPHASAVLADGALLVLGRAPPGSPAHGLHRFDRASGERVRIATQDHSDDHRIARAQYGGIRSTFERPVSAHDRHAVAPGGAFLAILIQSHPAEAGDGRATVSALSPLGDTLWSQTFRTPRVPIDHDIVQRRVREDGRAYGERVSRNWGVAREVAQRAYEEALAIPPQQLAFDRVVADADGAVLLRRGGFGMEEVQWWRVTEAGLDARFTLPADHEVVAAVGRRIYTTSTGPLDEPIITAWTATPE